MAEDDLLRQVILMSDRNLTDLIGQISDKIAMNPLYVLAMREAERRFLDIDLPFYRPGTPPADFQAC